MITTTAVGAQQYPNVKRATYKPFVPWVRPTDWLAMPEVTSTENKVVILTAVFDSPTNNVRLGIDTIAYTVDWGDGTVDSISAGGAAEHNYSYSNAALDGTLTSGGYKQAIITMTPTVGGQNISIVRFQNRYTGAPAVAYCTPFLDVIISAPSATYLKFGDAGNVVQGMLERVTILSCNLNDVVSMFKNCYKLNVINLPYSTRTATNLTNMFLNCYSLQQVSLFNTAGVTNMTGLFENCYALTTVPLFNTINVTNMTSMFNGCRSLQTVPLFNTINVTNMTTMFYACGALLTIPQFNTTYVANMASMFYQCIALQTIPLLNTISCTNMSGMFKNCYNLTSLPLLNTQNVTDMSNMFEACYLLRTIPQFNLAKVTTVYFMFAYCKTLRHAPQFTFNATGLTSVSYMYYECTNLTYVPAYTGTSPITNWSGMFYNCLSLMTCSSFTATAGTSSSAFTNLFAGCISLTRITVSQFKFTFSVASCRLSATALNELYTNLATVTGQTITVTGNPGTTGDDPTIATAKGWTVTG